MTDQLVWMRLRFSTWLQSISEEIRSATTSMTSVPKPLKFLRKHYDSVKAYYESMPESDNKPKLADVLSILAISSAAKDSRESLKFRLAGSKVGNLWICNLCIRPVSGQGNASTCTMHSSSLQSMRVALPFILALGHLLCLSSQAPCDQRPALTAKHSGLIFFCSPPS